jgi:acetyl-CoA acetyltransferase family protein
MGEVFIVGGAESMSQAPLLYQMTTAMKFATLNRARTTLARMRGVAAFHPSDFAPLIGLQLGLTDPVSGLNMGDTAEILAREFGINRHMQDAFALESHVRASAARGRMADEIRPAFSNGTAITTDNGIRENQTLDALAKLHPVFDRKTGTVTAGNASQITDGAVALLVMTRARAEHFGIEPLGYLSSYVYTGCDPRRMGLGPVSAVQNLGRSISEADIIEVNEAFAAQVLAVAMALKLPMDILNPNGGAIALGHPVGSTGARLALTSLLELKRRNANRALVSLCVGGGQGAAMWLERKE